MAKQRLGAWQSVALESPFVHTALFGGVATGKSFTGSHFVIKMIREHPDLTGFVGANNYDQLTQATLRELMYWLDAYGFQYVIDKRPPAAWKTKVKFKTYNNILSVMYRGNVVTIFTRVLGKGDPLRGLEFSWYWLDETRDTPQDTHNTVLARMRESEFTAGLITTTPNGKDWTFDRFVAGSDESGVYGSLHVPTSESLKVGLITQAYYHTLLRSYSTLLARQELGAEHLNVAEGRAYYAAGEYNEAIVSPWGDAQPTRERALIVGCDFNFNPAPMSWVFMQEGPDGAHEEKVHVFSEMTRVNMGTKEMTQLMVSMFPGFHLRIFGDASGKNQTTSNAGNSDYLQMQEALNEAGISYTLDIDPANPRVRDRVENVNRLCRNAIGETLLTYNPEQCPTLAKDCEQVQWNKQSGKLDAGKDGLLTHASDALGYPLAKIRPFGHQGAAILSVASFASQL